MEITEADIRRMFTEEAYRQAEKLSATDIQFRNVDHTVDIDAETIEADVLSGRQQAHAKVRYEDGTYQLACNSPSHGKAEDCWHCAALLLRLCWQQREERANGSSREARFALRVYADTRVQETVPASDSVPPQSVTVVPHLELGQDCSNWGSEFKPYLSFTIGMDRQYVVRDLPEFLSRFKNGEVFAYGKKLSFRHTYDSLTPESRQLLELIEDAISTQGEAYRYYGYYRNAVALSGGLFDRFFDMYTGKQVESGNTRLTFRRENPVIRLKTVRSEDGVTVLGTACSVYGRGRFRYVLVGDTLYACGEEFTKDMVPFLEQGLSNLYFSREDMTSFCGLILPRISKYVTLADPDGLLAQYRPDECTPCFRLDFDREYQSLTARLSFRYPDGEVPYGTDPKKTPALRRDMATEKTAELLLCRYMDVSGVSGALSDRFFTLTDEERQYRFLSDAVPALQAVGEVLISDSLSRLRVSPANVSVGMSVSDGMLRIEFNTGEFPPEELEALYQSLILRKKYHRLRDGRYLSLTDAGGNALETLAQAVHMSQIDPDAIRQGSVTVPLYRSLYLDSLMSGEAGMRVYRDNTLRGMIRRFKTVEESDFAVPAGMEQILRPYQETGFRWLKTLDSCGFGGILADEMGLGKTVEMIAYLSTVRRAGTGLASLVVCPTSLVYNWADEFARFAPDMHIRLIVGSAKERAALLEQAKQAEDDVLVTSYDLLKRDVEAYAGHEFYCTVLDEGQTVKNQSTLASRAVKSVSCRQRFVMTGTPIENRLSELWNLFDFLMPGYLFAHNRFVEKLEKPIIRSNSPEARKQLKKLVSPFLLRRLKRDVLKELPPKTEEVRTVALTEEERAVYAASVLAAKGLLTGDKDGQGEDGGRFRFLAALTRLRQICCDPSLCFENYRGQTSKLESCLELCRGMTENGHQILLFSQFTSMLDILRDALVKEGITCFTLTGATSKEDRARLVRDFNAGGAQVFLISLKAGGTGLNLTAADVVIHYDPWWNQAAQDQATDRAHRIGQHAPVHVYKLITKDTVEERILEMQEKKASLLDAVSGGEERSILALSREELLELLD